MLPPGKIEYPSLWSLRVKVTPVLTKHFVIMPADFVHPDLAPIDQINVSIFYDQKTLTVMRLGQDHESTFQIVDDQANHDHEIAFEMAGKLDEHTHGLGSNEITVCAQIEMWIETWRAVQFITQDKPLILGQNGVRESMHLQTPIYRWLVLNTGKIFGHYDLNIDHDAAKED